MNRPSVLRWIERALWAAGGILVLWSIGVLVEANFMQQLPVPAPRPSTASRPSSPTLPGDASSAPVPRPALPAAMAAGSWVAKLEAPSVKLTATVLEGTDDATLDRGAGHIEETPFPGQPGNIGIAGHRDTTFRAVRHLRLGDPIDITTRDRVYRYFVSKTFIVDPKDVYVLDPGDQPLLTLVTCYPFEFIGHAPRRYIIQAVLVDQAARLP